MKTIKRFEHQILRIGDDESFQRKHLDALIKLNTLHNGEYFEIVPNGVRFNQYVGAIQVDNLCIEIHPKADKYDDDSKWQNALIDMLRLSGKIKINPFEDAQLKKGNLNLLEVYFFQFLTEVELLIRNGLIKQYRKEEENVKALKGKLDFSKNIKYNLSHKERFYTLHQVYDVDHSLHQVLSQALDIVQNFSISMSINDKCKRVKMDFPEVRKMQITLQFLDSIKLNRKNASYSKALELARLIILNYSPNISNGKEKMISILFDMNALWEEFVYKSLKRFALKDTNGIVVKAQESKRFHGSRSIRPDIILEIQDKTIVIDTKWKIPKNNNASIEDLRQMYTYGRFWQSSKMILLYPGIFSKGSFTNYHNTTFDNTIHCCKVAKVSVIDENGTMNKSFAHQIIELCEIN